MISVEEHGWRAFRTHAFLDDVELKTCIAADPIEGWADCFEQDANGKLVIDEELRQPVLRRRYGTVRLEAVE